MQTLRYLLRKEFLQIFRDRFMVMQLLLMPIIQLLLLGNAATFEVKTARMYVVDRDHSETSRGLVDRLQASRRFIVVGSSPSVDVGNQWILERKTDMIVSIPADFERDIVRTRNSQVQLILNAEDGAAAGVTQSYAAQIVAAYANALGAELRPINMRPISPSALQDLGGGLSSASTQAVQASVSPISAQPIEVRARGWYNPDLNYRDYMVPGILVQLVTVVGTLMAAMNIVREKELGTLDQLSVTPLSQSAFMAAKLIPFWIIALIELTLGLLVARFVFHIPMLGSITLVFAAAAIYLFAALGIGLFISTLVDTQQQAMFVTFFIIMVYLLMSGLFTPIRSMPDWAQWMSQLNPVKHFIEIMRAVLLKGATARDVARPIGILALFGMVVLTLAVRQYGRRAG
ncbi:MAG TPA: ABC transporter permease [Gemmatimonadaceae bacterium]|nr:ABC transporter permease [Gemmatimonadaceae bacterium]